MAKALILLVAQLTHHFRIFMITNKLMAAMNLNDEKRLRSFFPKDFYYHEAMQVRQKMHFESSIKILNSDADFLINNLDELRKLRFIYNLGDSVTVNFFITAIKESEMSKEEAFPEHKKFNYRMNELKVSIPVDR